MKCEKYIFFVGSSKRPYSAYGKHPADAFEILKAHYGHRWTRSKKVSCVTPEGKTIKYRYEDL